MTRRKRIAPPLVANPSIEVFAKGGPDGDFGGEDVRGDDGLAIYPGRTVCRPRDFSESLRVTVPPAWGVVKRLYRTIAGGPVLVETTNGHTFYAATCVRSSKGESAEREHRRLIAANRAARLVRPPRR